MKNQGDLLNDCYLEVEIPSLSLSDSIIDDSDYIDYKNDLLSSIKTKRDNWKTDYDNFKNFSEIELKYYQTLVKSLQSDNVTISILKSKPKIKRSMWSRRAQEYEAKISSGKIYELAEVVRDLNKGDDLMVDQSYSERQLFEKAYERMQSEFQIILNNKVQLQRF